MTAIAEPAVVPARAAPATATRLVALDLMRGLVMVLMAIDHSSEAFNAGRIFGDSVMFWHPGTPLPAAQFLTRWITHLCAPTFLFLAGVGLAFTVRKETARGATAAALTRYILTRGVIIAAFELWITFFVMPPGTYLLQVLYAIGTSYVLMAALRFLPDRLALALGVLLLLGGEALVGLVAGAKGTPPPMIWQLLLTGGRTPHLIIGYPTLHWLAILLLGWAWGRALCTRPEAQAAAPRNLLLAGLAALAAFVVIRGLNGYGNMLLLRENGSFVQWLHVSKYPPSLTYVLLELGLMSLLLSGMFRLSSLHPPRKSNVLLVLGQTPMFFYLLHFPLLVVTAKLLGVDGKLGLGATYLGATFAVALLYPACLWYRGYKAAHQHGWPRYI